AWLAGLIADATGYAQRWHDLGPAPTDRAGALYLLIRLAWEGDDIAEMDRRTIEVEALLDHLPPGEHQARAMVAIAQSALLRDRIAVVLDWTDRAIAIADAQGLAD